MRLASAQESPQCDPNYLTTHTHTHIYIYIYIYIYISTRIFGPPFGRPRFFRLTSRPRFTKSGNCSRNQTLKTQLRRTSTYFCTEYRCVSCWHSHLTRSSTFWKKSRGGSNQRKSTNMSIYILKQSRGVLFSEVAEAPQAAARQTHRAGMC